jgi:hypothetical protein
MRFLVPQFIDLEPKVIGSLSVRQFITMLITFGLIFICYKLFTFLWFIFIALILFTTGGLFAFMSVNGRPFHYFLLNILETWRRPKLRIWHQNGKGLPEVIAKEKGEDKKQQIPPRQPMASRRLSEISLLVDTGGSYRENEQM